MAKAAPASSVLPTVGRIVHYGVTRIAAGPGDTDLVVPVAAIVTAVEIDEEDPKGTVTLTVFHPSGHQDIQHAIRSDELSAGAWMWPPRD